MSFEVDPNDPDIEFDVTFEDEDLEEAPYTLVELFFDLDGIMFLSIMEGMESG